MGKEGRGGKFPRRTDFASKETKKPQTVIDPTTMGRAEERSNTLGSLSRFMPGVAPHEVVRTGNEVVKPARVNHVNGTRITPIFDRRGRKK